MGKHGNTVLGPLWSPPACYFEKLVTAQVWLQREFVRKRKQKAYFPGFMYPFPKGRVQDWWNPEDAKFGDPLFKKYKIKCEVTIINYCSF